MHAFQATDDTGAAKARAVNAFLQQMLASSDPANAQGKELSVRELLDKAGTDMNAAALSGQPEVKAALESTIGRTYFGLGLYDQARPHLDSAYAIRRRTLGGGNLDVAVSADEVGKLAQAAGDYALADRRLTEALATMRKTLRPDDDRIISALSALGDVRQKQGKFPEALPYRVRGVLAFCLTRAGRFAEAEPLLLAAEARLVALPGGTAHRDLMMDWLVNLYEAWGNSAQAAAWKQRRVKRP